MPLHELSGDEFEVFCFLLLKQEYPKDNIYYFGKTGDAGGGGTRRVEMGSGLRKLLNDQIRSRERVNIVQSRGFRESLEATLTRYTNRAITTAQVIEELIGLVREIREAVRRGEESGLSEEEVAFYDALADNESAREVIQDKTLKLIARELSERIKAKASLDWTQRESVRADMRRTVRRLLSKYGYPPDLQEGATQLVIRQAELMAEGAVG